MGNYDASYLTAVQREIARSVKTNVLKELGDLDENAAAALLANADAVDLSPEAKAYLKALRKRMRDNKNNYQDKPGDEEDFQSLLMGLDDLKKSSQDEEENKTPKNPLFPSVITLSEYQPNAKRRKVKAYSPVRETVDRMIYYAPSKQAREKVQDELEVVGFEIVSQVKAFGVKIIVIERTSNLCQLRIHGMMVVAPSEKTFDGRPWSTVRGLYDNSRRLFVIGEEQLGRPGHSVVRHEFAHAYDHAFSETNHRVMPLSVQLWNLFKDKRTGLVSNYAGTNPAEYFAESVEAFFQPDGIEKLSKKDPKMCDYLKELFQVV